MQYLVNEPTAYQEGNTASDSSLCILVKSTTEQEINSYQFFLNLGIFFPMTD